jgi:hypothetical protein
MLFTAASLRTLCDNRITHISRGERLAGQRGSGPYITYPLTRQLCHSPETCPVHPRNVSLLFMPPIPRILVLLTPGFLSVESTRRL